MPAITLTSNQDREKRLPRELFHICDFKYNKYYHYYIMFACRFYKYIVVRYSFLPKLRRVRNKIIFNIS